MYKTPVAKFGSKKVKSGSKNMKPGYGGSPNVISEKLQGRKGFLKDNFRKGGK